MSFYVPSAPVTVQAQPSNVNTIVNSPNGVPAVLQSLQNNAVNETAAQPGGGTTPSLNKGINQTVTSSDGTTSVIINPA